MPVYYRVLKTAVKRLAVLPARTVQCGSDSMDVREKLLAAVDDSPFSDRKLSMLATSTPDTIRNIRRGTAPRADTLEALCVVLGVDLHFGPPLQTEPDTLPSRPPTRFSAKVTLPVRRWEDCSEDNYLSSPDDSEQAPAPEELTDQHAFYAQFRGLSMIPGGINPSDYCLISPYAQLQVDQRAWFRKRTGEEAVRWVMRLPPEVLDLGAWGPPQVDAGGHQKLVADRWAHGDIVDRGVVLDVYHDRPSVDRPLLPHARWRPDSIDELWRAALFSGDEKFRKAADQVDQAAAVVGQTGIQLGRLAVTGALSKSQHARLLRALEERVLATVRDIRETVAAMPVGDDREAPDSTQD